jgi:hypothetical protein
LSFEKKKSPVAGFERKKSGSTIGYCSGRNSLSQGNPNGAGATVGRSHGTVWDAPVGGLVTFGSNSSYRWRMVADGGVIIPKLRGCAENRSFEKN